jgi:NADPH2:quinone reductase
VRAAGCNFFDILMVQGKYQVKPAFPFVPGAEIAGVVRALGDGVTGFAKGDRVLASAGLGGFAEIAVVPAAGVYRMPEGMSFAEGAALPIIYPTSYAALVFRAHLAAGETLLVHAAAGGVGIAAVQIGKALGARVIATAGGAEKLEIARANGADEAIDYTKEDFAERVKQLTNGRGADVIYDSVGGDTFDQSLKCIAWNGRLLVIGFAGGRIPEVKANRILLKNISIVGLHWGAHVQHEPARIPETFQALFELYRAGKIRPVIFKSYPLEEVSVALEALGSRKTWGKVIVAP